MFLAPFIITATTNINNFTATAILATYVRKFANSMFTEQGARIRGTAVAVVLYFESPIHNILFVCKFAKF